MFYIIAILMMVAVLGGLWRRWYGGWCNHIGKTATWALSYALWLPVMSILSLPLHLVLILPLWATLFFVPKHHYAPKFEGDDPTKDLLYRYALPPLVFVVGLWELWAIPLIVGGLGVALSYTWVNKRMLDNQEKYQLNDFIDGVYSIAEIMAGAIMWLSLITTGLLYHEYFRHLT